MPAVQVRQALALPRHPSTLDDIYPSWPPPPPGLQNIKAQTTYKKQPKEFDDPEDPELIDVYPLNYDPQTHRFGRILPRDQTYHIERDTLHPSVIDRHRSPDIPLDQVPWPSGVPRPGTHQHIGYLAEPLHVRRTVAGHLQLPGTMSAPPSAPMALGGAMPGSTYVATSAAPANAAGLTTAGPAVRRKSAKDASLACSDKVVVEAEVGMTDRTPMGDFPGTAMMPASHELLHTMDDIQPGVSGVSVFKSVPGVKAAIVKENEEVYEVDGTFVHRSRMMPLPGAGIAEEAGLPGVPLKAPAQVAPPAIATEAQRKIQEAAHLGQQIAMLVERAVKVSEQSDELEAIAVQEKEVATKASDRAKTTVIELEEHVERLRKRLGEMRAQLRDKQQALASTRRELAQLNGVAHRKLEFVAMLKEEAAQRQRQVDDLLRAIDRLQVLQSEAKTSAAHAHAMEVEAAGVVGEVNIEKAKTLKLTAEFTAAEAELQQMNMRLAAAVAERNMAEPRSRLAAEEARVHAENAVAAEEKAKRAAQQWRRQAAEVDRLKDQEVRLWEQVRAIMGDGAGAPSKSILKEPEVLRKRRDVAAEAVARAEEAQAAAAEIQAEVVLPKIARKVAAAPIAEEVNPPAPPPPLEPSTPVKGGIGARTRVVAEAASPSPLGPTRAAAAPVKEPSPEPWGPGPEYAEGGREYLAPVTAGIEAEAEPEPEPAAPQGAAIEFVRVVATDEPVALTSAQQPVQAVVAATVEAPAARPAAETGSTTTARSGLAPQGDDGGRQAAPAPHVGGTGVQGGGGGEAAAPQEHPKDSTKLAGLVTRPSDDAGGPTSTGTTPRRQVTPRTASSDRPASHPVDGAGAGRRTASGAPGDPGAQQGAGGGGATAAEQQPESPPVKLAGGGMLRV